MYSLYTLKFLSVTCILLADFLYSVPAVTAELNSVSSPLPAPSRVTYPGWHLTALVPNGAVYCPIDISKGGSYHGTEFYLKKPMTCESKDLSENLPALSISYFVNARRQTVEEIAENQCKNGTVEKSSEISVLGRDTYICTLEEDDVYKKTFITSYNLDESAAVNRNIASVNLLISMITTKSRFTSDERAFKYMVQSMRLCSPKSGTKNSEDLECSTSGVGVLP